jgi:hypothetical protein
MIPGVMYYSDDLVGLMNEILVLIVKYFGCIKEREHLFSKIKNNAFFIKMIQVPLSCFVVNKNISK